MSKREKKRKKEDICKVTFLDSEFIMEGNCNEQAQRFARFHKTALEDLAQVQFMLNPQTEQYEIIEQEFKPISESDKEIIANGLVKYLEKYNELIDIFNTISPLASWSYLVLRDKIEATRFHLETGQDDFISKLNNPRTATISDVFREVGIADDLLSELPDLLGKVKIEAQIGHIEEIPGIRELRELLKKSSKK